MVFVEDRVAVNWGGFSQVEATLLSLEKGLCFDFDFAITLSGECLPIRNKLSIQGFLKQHDTSFVDIRIEPRYNYRVKSRHFRLGRVLNKILTYLCDILRLNNAFNDDEIRMGGAQLVLKKQHVNYVLKRSTDTYKSTFKYSTCADEHYFQMILKDEENITKKHLHYVKFDKGNANPNYLDSNFIYKIADNGYFFARKVQHETLLNYWGLNNSKDEKNNHKETIEKY